MGLSKFWELNEHFLKFKVSEFAQLMENTDK